MMKQIFAQAFNIFATFAISLSCGNSGTPEGPGKKPGDDVTGKDSLFFRVAVIADKPGVTYFGGERLYAQKLGILFKNVDNFWNNGSDEFDHVYSYVPTLIGVYDEQCEQAWTKAVNSFDFSKYDVLMCVDSKLDHEGETGGWNAGGNFASGLCLVQIKGGSTTEYENIFDDKGFRGVAHELGHYRGVTDIYATQVKAAGNWVNGLKYTPVPCIMHNHHGTGKWSDYAVGIINHTAKSKQPARDYKNLFDQMFANNMKIVVRKNNEPARAKVTVYGSRALHYNIYENAVATYQVPSSGEYVISNLHDIYCTPKAIGLVPQNTDLPWGRLFALLLKIECDGAVKYEYVPEYLPQMCFFAETAEERATYTLTVNF